MFCFFFFFLRFFFFFFLWTISKVFIEFVTILLLFYVLVFWPQGMWNLNSPTRDQTRTPCVERRNLNHWTAQDVPGRISILQFLMELGCKEPR